jgi:DNA-binding NtrC family response regulator
MHDIRRERGGSTLKALVEDYERQLILSALQATSGNQRRAAAALGVLPTTLHEKMKRLGLIQRSDSPPATEELALTS